MVGRGTYRGRDLDMNTRHAAALALVAWVLVFPQFRHDAKTDSWSLDSKLPLSQWRKSGPFDSAAECQHRIVRFRTDASAAFDRQMKDWHLHHDDPRESDDVSFMTAAKAQAGAAMCVETGDPRLKEKPAGPALSH